MQNELINGWGVQLQGKLSIVQEFVRSVDWGMGRGRQHDCITDRDVAEVSN